MINIRDIAAECKLSVATVSKALNGYKDVSEETRTRVLEISRKLGYIPNASARALKTNRTFNIGILFTDDQNNGLTHYHFSHVLNSFNNEIERSGYNITFINRRFGQEKVSLLQNCKFRGIEGVIIVCVDENDPELLELTKSDIPFISVDHVYPGSPTILSDNRNDIKKLIRYIYSLGHRKIAYIHGNPNNVTYERVAGYKEAHEELGMPIREEYMKESYYTNAYTTRRATEQILALSDRPTCILTPDDLSAFGCIEGIKAAGLSVPDDISVAGYDGILFSQIMTPKLTTMKQDTAKIGEHAARLLIYTIENPDKPDISPVVIKSELIKGQSVGPI